jgi:hypothetical protein
MSLGLMALRPKNASRILRVCLLLRDVIADGAVNSRTDSGRNADACPTVHVLLEGGVPRTLPSDNDFYWWLGEFSPPLAEWGLCTLQ